MLDEAQNFAVSADDKLVLRGHGDTREWKTLKGIVEKSILKWTSNLLTGSEIEPGSRAKELERLSGFVYFWRKIVAVIEFQEEK